MTYKTLRELVCEQEKVSAQIRAYRVKEIRRSLVTLRSSLVWRARGSHIQLSALQMEEKIQSVFYSKSEFDDLLSQIESQLEDLGCQLETSDTATPTTTSPVTITHHGIY